MLAVSFWTYGLLPHKSFALDGIVDYARDLTKKIVNMLCDGRGESVDAYLLDPFALEARFTWTRATVSPDVHMLRQRYG